MGRSLMRRGDGGLGRTFVRLVVVLGILSSVGMDVVEAQLSLDFYNVTCPAVEQIVRDTMITHFHNNRKVAAQVLRLQFHDCGATGCDASLLLTGQQSEQNAPPNLSLKAFDVIDDIKAQVEANCPGIVSCADIMAMAARDAVSLTGGPNFHVPLGRFDSIASGGPNVNLPSPSSSVPAIINFFLGMGLSTKDMVVLLGSHTIGEGHCSSFRNRLFNFNTTFSADPTLDPPFLALLQRTCPLGQPTDDNTTVALDLQSEFVFDNHFYLETIKRHGVLGIDQEIYFHPLTSHTVFQMAANASLFAQSFATSLVKMGQFGVKDGSNGHIRLTCSV